MITLWHIVRLPRTRQHAKWRKVITISYEYPDISSFHHNRSGCTLYYLDFKSRTSQLWNKLRNQSKPLEIAPDLQTLNGPSRKGVLCHTHSPIRTYVQLHSTFSTSLRFSRLHANKSTNPVTERCHWGSPRIP